MRNTGVLAIGATVLFLLGVAGQGVAPLYYPANQPAEPALRKLTPEEERGRDLYRREGCFHCHTQVVRPVGGEELRYGPIAKAGEYAGMPTPALGVRRLGPDLSRVGGKVENGWHYAHLWDPRLLVPDSVMPAYPWLFRTVTIPVDTMGEVKQFGVLPDAAAEFFDVKSADKVEVPADPQGRAFLADADGKPATKLPGKPELRLPGKPVDFSPKVVTVIAATQDLLDLVAWLQSQGREAGAGQGGFLAVEGGADAVAGDSALRLGREVYERRCVGCHGEKGGGDGPAATFLRTKPKPFAASGEAGPASAISFKFHSAPAPADGAALPAFRMMPERDRWAVVHYVRSLATGTESQEKK